MSTLDQKLISLLTTIKSPKKISKFQELIDRSKPFLKHAPSSENWLHKVGQTREHQETLVKFANSSYPILHEDVLGLVSDFLEFKKINGNEVEKKVYKDLNFINMTERLISCRPFSFYGPGDKFFLRNFKAGHGNWHRVGTKSENPSVSLRNYMSYDEIKLAAFLQVSSPVLPINAGSRTNKGIIDSNHVQEAIYVGAVGARFEKEDFMEFQDMVVTSIQNTPENGYGPGQSELTLKSVFAKFYNIDYFPVHTEFPGFFNDSIYLRRIQISIETFLIEANRRGLESNKRVYVHVVGLGLGVWMLNPGAQKRIYLEAFQNSLMKLCLPNIACLDFSWLDPHEKVPSLRSGKNFQDTDILIRFSKNDPFSDLEEKNNFLVVALYAWDGNSFPGNEYWCGDRTASGDPAAACCTQIPQLQNAYINCENICSSNLHVASCEHGLLHISKFAQKVLEKNSLKT